MNEDYVIKNTKICGFIQSFVFRLINVISFLLTGLEFEEYYACLECARNRNCGYGSSFVWTVKTAYKITEMVERYYPLDESWQKPPSLFKERLLEPFDFIYNILTDLPNILKYGTNFEPQLLDIIRNDASWRWLWSTPNERVESA